MLIGKIIEWKKSNYRRTQPQRALIYAGVFDQTFAKLVGKADNN